MNFIYWKLFFSFLIPRNYNASVQCMEERGQQNCQNQETFHVLTSGIRYMCIEQRKAFGAVIECVDAQAADVEKGEFF